MALNCGGLVADHGWFRLHGAGAEGLASLADVIGLATSAAPLLGFLRVGYDVLGGVFAVDGGALGASAGEVCYFGPDTLDWGGLGVGYTDFLHALVSGDLGRAFESLRWPGWQDEVQSLGLAQGLSIYPPPFTREGCDIAQASRRPAPVAELHAYYRDMATQLGELTPGLNI